MKPTEDGKALIKAFFEKFGTFDFPQPLVAEAIVVNTNDLNLWRMRGHLTGWEKNGRVTYIGLAVVQAGILGELGWIVGPETAAKINEALINYLLDFATRAARGEPVWADPSYLSFMKPTWDRDRSVHLRADSSESNPPLGLALYQAPKESFRDFTRATVVVPLSNLLCQWAIGVEQRMACGAGA